MAMPLCIACEVFLKHLFSHKKHISWSVFMCSWNYLHKCRFSRSIFSTQSMPLRLTRLNAHYQVPMYLEIVWLYLIISIFRYSYYAHFLICTATKYYISIRCRNSPVSIIALAFFDIFLAHLVSFISNFCFFLEFV